MGKIADALNKYSKERKTVRIQKVTKADLEALMTYDRETGHLLRYDKGTGQVNHNRLEEMIRLERENYNASGDNK